MNEQPQFSTDDETSPDEVAAVIAKALMDGHARVTGAEAGGDNRFARLTVWLPSGQEFSIQIEEV